MTLPAKVVFIVCLAGSARLGQAQTGAASTQEPAPAAPSAPTPARHTGCVSKLPNLERYVLATGGRCMLLSGSFKPTGIAGHLATLNGITLEPTGMKPLTLEVESVVEVKDACTQTCTLAPPGTRNVHNKEKPGTEGGPPGAKPLPAPQAPQ